MLEFSFCVLQDYSTIWALFVASGQVILGALMCLLIIIKFIVESLQMYKARKRYRFQLGRYTNLLVREGMIYYLAYVYVSSFLLFPLPRH